MTHKVKIFENVFPDSATGHRNTFRDQIWWKSVVAKLPKGRVVYQTKKTRAPRDSYIMPKMGRSSPKFSKRCHLLTCPRVPNLVQIGCVLRDLFRKDWFFDPKSQYNIGFQPTIKMNCTAHSVTRHFLITATVKVNTPKKKAKITSDHIHNNIYIRLYHIMHIKKSIYWSTNKPL